MVRFHPRASLSFYTVRQTFRKRVIAALNFGALGLGLAGGGLVGSLLGLIVGGGLTVFGMESGADLGLLTGVLSGLLTAGWIAGTRSIHSHRFHGSVVGLLFAGLLIFLASLGQAQASVLTVAWLAVLSAVVGGIGGSMGGRQRTGRSRM